MKSNLPENTSIEDSNPDELHTIGWKHNVIIRIKITQPNHSDIDQSKQSRKDMAQKYSKLSLLGTNGRLTRIMYFLFSFIIPLSIFWISSALIGQLLKHNIISEMIGFFFLLFAIVIGIIIIIRQTIQRSHDFNKSGWLTVLLMLFPPFILLFWVIPGDTTVNGYGEPVKPLSNGMTWLVGLTFSTLLIFTSYLFYQYSVFQLIGTWFSRLFF
ncbi:MAG: DUF805 domain-containing protein [Thiotrichaceae bacterium]|nr:DUF805 domain-containing protein [Thiotrichaceae bacterium]